MAKRSTIAVAQPPKPRKRTTTVCLEITQLARLRRLNDVTRVPTAERIREGIDLVLDAAEAEVARAGRQLPPLEGLQ